MTLWSDLFKSGGSGLPAVVPGDIGKVAIVRAGPAWVVDFLGVPDIDHALGYRAANAAGQDFHPGNVAALAVYAGDTNQVQLAAQAGAYARISFDLPKATFLQLAVPAQQWEWVYDGSPAAVHTLNKNGGGWFKGDVSANGFHGYGSVSLNIYKTGILSLPALRWQVAQDNIAESGANAGSNFCVNRYDDGSKLVRSKITAHWSCAARPARRRLAAASPPLVEWRAVGVTSAGYLVTEGGGVAFQTPAAENRWAIYPTGGEAAGNVGNDLNFQSSDNAGNYLGTPLTLRRSDSAALFSGAVTAPNYRSPNGKLNITTDATDTWFIADTDQTFLSYTYAAKRWSFYAAGVSVASITATSTSFAGMVYATNGLTVSGAGALYINTAVVMNGNNTTYYQLGGVSRYATGVEGGGNFFWNVNDASGNYVTQPIVISGTTYAVQIGNLSELRLTRSEQGAWGSVGNALRLNGSGPGITFDNNAAGTKIVIQQVGSLPRQLEFGKGDGSQHPIVFNIDSGVCTAPSWSSTSDRRLKWDLRRLRRGLDIITGLDPYTYKQAVNFAEAAERHGRFGAGIMAQDLTGTPLENLVIPGAPSPYEGEEDGPLSFDYNGLHAYYIAAFKEVASRLNTLEARAQP